MKHKNAYSQPRRLRYINLFTIAASDLSSRRGRTAFITFGFSVGIAFILFLSSLCLGVRSLIFNKILPSFSSTQLEVRQKEFNVWIIKFGNFLAPINDATIEEIENMRGVVNVLPLFSVGFPASAVGDIFSSSLVTQTAIFGIERELVADDLPKDVKFSYDHSTDVVPAVISSLLLDMYNISIAPTEGLPKMNEKIVLGREFDLRLGVSMMNRRSPKTKIVRCKIVGVSSKVPVVGVSVPIGYAREWDQWYFGKDKATKNYFSLIVNTVSAPDTDRVARAIEEMGLTVISGKEKARKITMLARVVTIFLISISVCILLLAAMGIMNNLSISIIERSAWLGLLRSFGARRMDIVMIILNEGVIIGLLGAAFGICLGYVAIRIANHFTTESAFAVLSKFEGLFSLSWSLWLYAILFSAVVGGLSGLLPALRASRIRPADALRGS